MFDAIRYLMVWMVIIIVHRFKHKEVAFSAVTAVYTGFGFGSLVGQNKEQC
jgi:dolichol kinase